MTEKIPIPECCESICRIPDEKDYYLYEDGIGTLGERHPMDREIPLEEDVEHQIRRGHLNNNYDCKRHKKSTL